VARFGLPRRWLVRSRAVVDAWGCSDVGLLTSILVGGALAGGLFAGKKLGKKKPAQVTPTANPVAAPSPDVVAAPVAQAQAQKAAATQRKKAIGDGRQSTILTGPRGLENQRMNGRKRALVPVIGSGLR
jgi:hypothetical protein